MADIHPGNSAQVAGASTRQEPTDAPTHMSAQSLLLGALDARQTIELLLNPPSNVSGLSGVAEQLPRVLLSRDAIAMVVLLLELEGGRVQLRERGARQQRAIDPVPGRQCSQVPR